MANRSELPYELFRVLDTETNEYWKTFGGKSVWNKAGHAKSAWTTTHYRIGKFDTQSRYVIMKFTTNEWHMEAIE